MSSLTIIVPRVGADVDFETTLASVLRYRLPHHQVIAVQGPDQTDTYGLGDEVEFLSGPIAPALGSCLNAALPAVRGEVVHILRPGVEVFNHWFAHGIRQLRHPAIGCVAVPVAGRDGQQIFSCGIAPTCRMIPRHQRTFQQRPAGPGCWAGFYRRTLLECLSPLDEHLSDAFFGLDIALSMAGLGFQCGVVEDRAVTVRDTGCLELRPSATIGRDGQRMRQRHLDPHGVTPGQRIAAAWEIVRSLVQPDHWAQLAGRFSARHWQANDRGFCQRLALLQHQLESESDTRRNPAPPRRAA